jgi:mono/diheme cytochrome c family protein
MTRSARLMVGGFVVLAAGWVLYGQEADSERGSEILRDRGCLDCHGLAGGGGRTAPDLGHPGAGPFSPSAFASGLWNHSPGMWRAHEREARPMPELSQEDMRSVFAHLYAVRYFEPAGDQRQGEAVFRVKECFRCHAIVDTAAGGIGPAVSAWPWPAEPLRFLESMWNHAGVMKEYLEADGRRWPEFDSQEMADLLAYVYGLPATPPRPARMTFGRAGAGMRVFADLECGACHTLLDGDRDRIPLAAAPREQRTLTDLAVQMWNHRPVMEEWAAETGREIRPFEQGQMAHLLAYLFREGVLEERGNSVKGRALFRNKGCASCHGQDGVRVPIRDYYAIDLATAAWRHGPEVRDEMVRKGFDWPRLSAEEMADITAYLNTR